MGYFTPDMLIFIFYSEGDQEKITGVNNKADRKKNF